MGKPVAVSQLSLQVSDVSGQKVFAVANAPADATVGEFVREMLGKMGLPRVDAGLGC